MKFLDILKLSTRMFKARTSRTLLTILGMSVGISAILFLVSLGYGLQNVLLESITTSDSLLSLDATPSDPDKLPLTKQKIQEIENEDSIVEVSPVSQMSSQIQFNNLTSDITALITKPSFFKLDGVKLLEGEILKDGLENSVVISTAFAKIFNKEGSEMIGEKFSLMLNVPIAENEEKGKANVSTKPIGLEEDFQIVGLVEKEEPLMYLNLADISKQIDIPYYSKIKVKCSSQETLVPTREKLSGMGFVVSSLSDTVDQANKVFKGVQIVLALFGVIALIVSAIGMFNTMTVTLLERTEEIGIMKSIGVSDRDILMMFVCESSIMGFLGGLGGIIIGFAVGQFFNLGLNLVAQRFGGEPIALFQSPLWFLALITILGAIVGFLTGVAPARRASMIDPLDALRYK